MRYPETFVRDVKNVFPDHKRLHLALEQGDQTARLKLARIYLETVDLVMQAERFKHNLPPAAQMNLIEDMAFLRRKAEEALEFLDEMNRMETSKTRSLAVWHGFWPTTRH